MSKRILVVEDQEDLRGVLRDLLTGSGYAVIEAGDGQAGVAKAKSDRPDLILMDIQMPIIDGYEATRVTTARSPDMTAVVPVRTPRRVVCALVLMFLSSLGCLVRGKIRALGRSSNYLTGKHWRAPVDNNEASRAALGTDAPKPQRVTATALPRQRMRNNNPWVRSNSGTSTVTMK